MERPTQHIDLGEGYSADIATYFTQGERFAISDLWQQTSERVTLKDKDGNDTGVTQVTGAGYRKASRDLTFNTAVKAVYFEAVRIDGTSASAIEMLPSTVFDKLVAAINALTPKDDEKKA